MAFLQIMGTSNRPSQNNVVMNNEDDNITLGKLRYTLTKKVEEMRASLNNSSCCFPNKWTYRRESV